MAIFIQKITVEWDKRSRDSLSSKKRSKLPKLYTIPDEIDDFIQIQEIFYTFYDDYKKPRVKPPKKINEVQIHQNGFKLFENYKELTVRYCNTQRNEMFHKHVGTLTYNSWLRLLTNCRITHEHTWYYQNIIFNLYFGEPKKINDIVRTQTARIIFDDRVSLYWVHT